MLIGQELYSCGATYVHSVKRMPSAMYYYTCSNVTVGSRRP